MTTISSRFAHYATKFTFFAASLAFGISVAQGQVVDNIHGNTPATVQAYRSGTDLGFEARNAQARVIDRSARSARAQSPVAASRYSQPRSAGSLAGSAYIDQDPDVNVRMLVQKDFAHQ